MALLGVYVNAGTACLTGGLNCFLHGIVAPFTPDYASYQIHANAVVGAGTTGGLISVPIGLVSLTSSVVIWRSGNGNVGVDGSMFVARFHELIR